MCRLRLPVRSSLWLIVFLLLPRSLQSSKISFVEPAVRHSQLYPCPAPCEDVNPDSWTVFTTVERLSMCQEAMMLDFAIFNPLDHVETTIKVRACTVISQAQVNTTLGNFPNIARAANLTSASGVVSLEIDDALRLPSGDELLRQFKIYPRGSSLTAFYAYKGLYAGVYAGPAISQSFVVAAVSIMEEHHSSFAQLCGNRSAHDILGISIATSLSVVQRSVRGWAEAKCVAGHFTVANITKTDDKKTPLQQPHIIRRGDCTTTRVVAGDSCSSLVDRCSITAGQFLAFNPSPGLCSSLQPGQPVCCTSGPLPNLTPRVNDDGSCATYVVRSEDSCSMIATSHGLTVDQLKTFNSGRTRTWGWNGCDNLVVGINICLSSGTPPMPASVANAICGPTKPGSEPPAALEGMAGLNPCPLKACCNVWGQCGVSADFCTEKRGPSDNPGTSPAGSNGCISNCGLDITNNDVQPTKFGRVGYYESWNLERPCGTLEAKNSNTDGSYTIIHWAFAEINTNDWTVRIRDEHSQWAGFKSLTTKRVISFGGWGYSNGPDTYDILRQAMSPTNRNLFAANVAAFVRTEGLDGVDFDWEYPGAMDIPGTPAGLPTDGEDYLRFLVVQKEALRLGLPYETTLSIAAPSSFWYLKNFPIEEMARTVDYIVYMTYDLHGQWDAGNIWSEDGCPSGNCLRSHVNITEVSLSLVMITKAGVPAYKIYVGETSYGRSFKMAQAGCSEPMCLFLGDAGNSPARPGRCTSTPGYISHAEVEEIIRTGRVQRNDHDGDSNSDILVYNDTEYVAYMTDTTKKTRRGHWKDYNFGGTIDWAVDLQTSFDPAQYLWVDPIIWDMDQPSFTCSPPCNVKIPPWTGATSTVDYPLITVSDGSWTSTITRAPLTISEMVFEVVTLTGGIAGKIKRLGSEVFWPVPQPTSYWPPVTYAGPDGSAKTTMPMVPFPTPSKSIGPGAPLPSQGTWPVRPIIAHYGALSEPLVEQCQFADNNCRNLWKNIVGANNSMSFDPYEYTENLDDLATVCPMSTKSANPVVTLEPLPSPLEIANPELNEVYCYNSGHKALHGSLTYAIDTACSDIVERPNSSQNVRRNGHYQKDIGGMQLEFRADSGCSYDISYAECRRYFLVPVDSCNCGGVNGKQGGRLRNNCWEFTIDPKNPDF